MKLGVGFVIFSGAEFLKPALLNIRPFAHYIVGAYSLFSNTGEPAPAYLENLLFQLRNDGLIDELVLHKHPSTKVFEKMRLFNEDKYKLGQASCLRNGCSHYMLRDCDEFYFPEQIAKQWDIFSQFDCTVAPIQEYFHTPISKVKGLSELFVPVIHKIELEYKRKSNAFGVLVDGKRIVQPIKTFKVFKPEELTMHHMTCVRFNKRELLRKYEGHPHFIKKEGSLKNYLKSIEDFPIEQLEKVDDKFKILEYWKSEFGDIYNK